MPSNIERTPGPWVADGYEVKQPGGRMVAYCGPHHTPDHEYPASCRLQDEENARYIANAPSRIAELERENARLRTAIAETLADNLHLADGENCTLIKLKRALSSNVSHQPPL